MDQLNKVSFESGEADSGLKAQAAFFSGLSKQIYLIDIQAKLIELLAITSGNGSSAEFVKCLGDVMGCFAFSEILVLLRDGGAGGGGKCRITFGLKRRGDSFVESTPLFENATSGLAFLDNDEKPREESCYVAGEYAVLPGFLGDQRLGYVLLGLSGSADPNQIENFEIFKKMVVPLCFWAARAFSREPAPSFESRMGRMGISLNSKQRRILALIVKGGANKEIANYVNLSEQAVKYHVGNLLQKFGVTNRADLRVIISQMNFVPEPN